MSNKKDKNSLTKEFIDGLENKDAAIVFKTLEKIENKGNADLIAPIIHAGIKWQERKIQDVIQRILFGIKISAAHPIMLEELKNMEANPFRKVLISAIWEAEINSLDDLDTFVRIAIEGDLYEAIECLTVIEEAVGALNEEKIMESLLLLKEYYSDPANKENDKNPFIQNIMDKVSDLNKGFI